MISERFDFPSADGHRLAARLERPDGPARAAALFAHCFTCGKDNLATARIARRLTDAGIATLRFDFTGLGASEGDFANTGFSSNIADLVAAADAMAARDLPPLLLIGHSLGGAAVIAAAARIRWARAVATINAPANADHALHQFGDHIEMIESTGEAEVQLGGRPFTIRRSFVEDVRAVRLAHDVAALGRALLILHAPTDRTVGIDNAAQLYQAARHPKSFVALTGADHLLTGPGDAFYAADVIAAWAGRYL